MAMPKVNTRLMAAIFSVTPMMSQKASLDSTRFQLARPTH